MQFTVQARLPLDDATASVLDELGDRHGKLLRSLYACVAKNGGRAADYKVAFCAQHQITARAFNALRVTVQGNIDSVRELLKARVKELSTQIRSTKRKLKASAVLLDKHRAGKVRLLPVKLAATQRAHHFRQRAWVKKEQKLAAVKQRLAAPVPGIAFGSRKLFRQQWHIGTTAFNNLTEWKQAWRAARSHQLFYLGSKDETAGNQSCVATLQKDGSWTLQLRHPDNTLKGADRYLNLAGIRFPHGHPQLAAALARGQALSYRFHRDERGWRVFVSFEQPATALVTRAATYGVVGVDFNQTHLAAAEVDAYGNARAFCNLVFAADSAGEQAERLTLAIRTLAMDCARQKLAMVIEDLNFEAKKQRLSEDGASAARQRQLSGLQYAQYLSQVARQCERHGVQLIRVNPAYTSLAGRLKYAARLGVTVHEAAALVIGRSGQQRKERVPRSGPLAVPGMAAALPFVVPVWKATENGKGRWACLSGLLRVHRRRCWTATRSGVVSPAAGSTGNRRSGVGSSRAPRAGAVVPPADSSPLTW